MSKETCTRVFLAAVAAFVAGLALAAVAAIIAISNDVFVMNGPDVVGVRWTSAAWITLALGVLAALAMVTAAVTGFIAWLGAVIDTSQAEDKTWFIVLLVTGLVGLGAVAMVVYVIAGPADAPPQLAVGTGAPPAGGQTSGHLAEVG